MATVSGELYGAGLEWAIDRDASAGKRGGEGSQAQPLCGPRGPAETGTARFRFAKERMGREARERHLIHQVLF